MKYYEVFPGKIHNFKSSGKQKLIAASIFVLILCLILFILIRIFTHSQNIAKCPFEMNSEILFYNGTKENCLRSGYGIFLILFHRNYHIQEWNKMQWILV